jgi:DNA-binding IscR family transcriptional regulator
MPCAGADNLEACDRPQPCSVHEVFQRVYEALDASMTATTIADVAATAGGPPFPPRVRRRHAAEHAALAERAIAVEAQASDGTSPARPIAQ